MKNQLKLSSAIIKRLLLKHNTLSNYSNSPFRGLAAVFFLFAFSLSAQIIVEGQSSLIYSLPKAEFVVSAVVEKVTETPGQFYQYSERYLATSDVITSKKTYYRLKSLNVTPRTLPDKERTFTIFPKKKSLASLITVTDEGILSGINTPPVQVHREREFVKKEVGGGRPEQKLLPLNEEYMLAGSTAKMAEGIAKQIYSIRENRIDLLAGDVEYVPADGVSMKTMIEQMNQQEEELTKLFVGAIVVEELTQEMIYTPSKAVKNEVVFRFSEYQGMVPADDLSGVPYYITISFEPVNIIAAEKKKKAKEEEVYCIVPVLADVVFDDGAKVFFEKKIAVPQLGVLMPIPLETMDKYSRAFISPETGRLLSVEQGQKK